MKTNLLCTFVHKSDLQLALEYICDTYQLHSNMIFVLSNVNNISQYYCTYNVIGEYKLTPNTILIHRNSETNSLYTINALNEIIETVNNGVLDMNYQIDWELYRNTLLLVNNNEVIEIPLKLENIIKL